MIEWHWFLSCRVAWRENMGKINNFEKSAKMGQKMFFFENLKKYSPKDQVKSYSEMWLNPWFSLEMYLKKLFDEDLLCENSTCHKNKVALNFSNTGSFLKLGTNPCVNIFEMQFRKYWHEDLALTSKMKPCLKNLTPPVMQKYSNFSKCDM